MKYFCWCRVFFPVAEIKPTQIASNNNNDNNNSNTYMHLLLLPLLLCVVVVISNSNSSTTLDFNKSEWIQLKIICFCFIYFYFHFLTLLLLFVYIWCGYVAVQREFMTIGGSDRLLKMILMIPRFLEVWKYSQQICDVDVQKGLKINYINIKLNFIY